MKRVLLAAVLLAGGCGGRTRHAAGPPPEYERPVVPPWDAGKPVDPLEQALEHGEAVGPPETPADAGPHTDAVAPAPGDR